MPYSVDAIQEQNGHWYAVVEGADGTDVVSIPCLSEEDALNVAHVWGGAVYGLPSTSINPTSALVGCSCVT